ncbi:hypothetical protein SNEBB_006295 [Seison nebaliae]|nr:hypothetical protein SNEBB_006295 [Seison nebaliae]
MEVDGDNKKKETNIVQKPLKIKYGKIQGVAIWKWIATDDTCGICRCYFDACCPDCTLPGTSCPVASGKCNHSFHFHCIKKWVKTEGTNSRCPMCRASWADIDRTFDRQNNYYEY